MTVAVYQLEQSEDIPEKYYGMIEWSPVLGALLASGIIPSSPNEHQFSDPVWFVRQFCELNFLDHSSGVDSHRVRKYQYILKQYREKFGVDSHAITPQKFLAWLENNPVPKLDSAGNPIKGISSLSPPESLQDLGVRKNSSARRQDDLIPIIEQCQKGVTDPNDYHKVWDKLIEITKGPNRPLALIEHITGKNGGKIKYCKGDSDGFLTKDALRKRLDRNARGRKKPKVSPTKDKLEPT